MSWFLAFVGFALLVIFHELGHFAAAKAVGMRVERFSLFFPPKLFGIQRGETEYMVGAIPLGGFVRITGMNPDEELPPELRARSYAGSPVWKRIFVISAGPAVNLLIAFLIFAGIFLAQGKAVPGIVVGDTEAGSPAANVLQADDRITAVRLTEHGQTKTVAADDHTLSEDEMNARAKALVAAIATGGCGAAQTGKAAGGTPKVAQCTKPGQITVLYTRGGKPQTATLTPAYDAKLQRYRLGLAFQRRPVDVGVAGAAGASLDTMWQVTSETVKAIGRLVYSPQARKEVSGVVGSYEATRESIAIDPVLTLQIIGFISLSLAVVNLFPFLPLDGGHIFWALVEKARGGRPVSTATLERASIVGFMLVIALAFIGLNNDVHRITSGQGFGIQR